MTETLSECHFQSSQINITELLISSVRQDAHERIVMKAFSECHSQSSQMSITEVLLTKTQSSQFKSSKYMLLKDDESMNESTNETLSDASDSDSAPVCLLPAASFTLVTLASDTESSPVISVAHQQQITTFSKVSHSDLLSIKQRKYNRKIK